jgi:hypothetical protein
LKASLRAAESSAAQTLARAIQPASVVWANTRFHTVCEPGKRSGIPASRLSAANTPITITMFIGLPAMSPTTTSGRRMDHSNSPAALRSRSRWSGRKCRRARPGQRSFQRL